MTKVPEELEQEIMEYIFSNRCPDHHDALDIWNGNPWIAVSMYEVAHYPGNLALQLCFPAEVEVPKWFLQKLQNEEQLAMAGDPMYIAYPRAKPTEIESNGEYLGFVDKFGRLHVENYGEE